MTDHEVVLSGSADVGTKPASLVHRSIHLGSGQHGLVEQRDLTLIQALPMGNEVETAQPLACRRATAKQGRSRQTRIAGRLRGRAKPGRVARVHESHEFAPNVSVSSIMTNKIIDPSVKLP